MTIDESITYFQKGIQMTFRSSVFLSLKCINSSLIIPYHQSVQTNTFSDWDSNPFVNNNKNTARDRHCGNKRGRLCLKCCAVSLEISFTVQFRSSSSRGNHYRPGQSESEVNHVNCCQEQWESQSSVQHGEWGLRKVCD